MARRYDSSTTIFSPEGRLHQVEYAIQSIEQAGTCVGIVGSDGVVFAAKKTVTEKLLAPSKKSEKIYKIDSHLAACVAGLTSDANLLIENARLDSQKYLYNFQENMPVEQLVKSVCDYKHSYTQYGGLRPFGVSFLFAGYDSHYNYQLYESDPAGNYSSWSATCIGANSNAGKSVLKTEYDENSSLDANLRLAIKVMLKTLDHATPTAENIELFTLTKTETGKLIHKYLSDTEITSLIDEVQASTTTEGDM